MKCAHPECTGMHDNNRWSELCPRAIERKRDKDCRYYNTTIKGFRARMAKKWGIPVADHQALLKRYKTDPAGVFAELFKARYPEWFAGTATTTGEEQNGGRRVAGAVRPADS